MEHNASPHHWRTSCRAPLLLMLVSQQLAQADALVAHGIARVPIELGGAVYIGPSQGEPPLTTELAARGCVVGRYKGYSLGFPAFTQPTGSHTLNAPALLENATSIRCTMPPVRTAGNTTIVLDTRDPARCRGWPVCGGPHRFACNASQQGGFGCAWMEYFALFAPAFSRRPYVGEDTGAIVVETDYSLAGMLLHLSATVGGVAVRGSIEGGRRSRLEFSLASLPAWVNEMVSITVTLPDGTNITKTRKFLRAPPPSANATTTVVQSDGESPGLLFDGQRQLANGWFGSWNISSQGPGGISFISKGGIRPDKSFLLPGQEANYSKQWAEIHSYLDAAADAGVHVMSWIGIDTWAICRTGFPATGEGVHAGCQKTWPNGSTICVNSSDSNPDRCTGGHHIFDPVAAQQLEAFVLDNVRQLRNHSANAGFYGCDDCCHTSKGFALGGAEVKQLAQIYDILFEHDPCELH